MAFTLVEPFLVLIRSIYDLNRCNEEMNREMFFYRLPYVSDPSQCHYALLIYHALSY